MTGVRVAGWELRCTDGTSNKFYQVFTAGDLAFYRYGAIGSAGAWSFPAITLAGAEADAVKQAMTKGRRGYLLHSRLIAFDITAAEYESLRIETSVSATLSTVGMRFNHELRQPTNLHPIPVSVVAADLHRQLRTAALSTPSPAPAAPATSPGRRGKRPELAAVGPSARPNGEIYQPRELAGHEDLAVMRTAQSRGEHLLLEGPPGTGKTALVDSAWPDAELMIGSGDTTVADLVGTFVQDPVTGNYDWAPGPLHRSVLRDVPLFIDEIGLIDSKELAPLYSLMDGRGLLHISANSTLDPIPAGPNWILVGAYNPDVPGVNISDALHDRFDHHIEVGSDFDLALEFGVPGPMVTVARNLEVKRLKGEISWAPQFRAMLKFKKLALAYGEDYAASNLISTAPRHDRAEVAKSVTAHWARAGALKLGKRMSS